MPVPLKSVTIGLFLILSAGWNVVSAPGADLPPDETATVIVQGRQFRPPRTVLHQGRRTTLIFKNQDSELHAVVPLGLFEGASLNVSGNGAPEFGPEGFKRVIIPPDGLAEIRFIPTKTGTYRYLCDMPGHEMEAVIEVE